MVFQVVAMMLLAGCFGIAHKEEQLQISLLYILYLTSSKAFVYSLELYADRPTCLPFICICINIFVYLS